MTAEECRRFADRCLEWAARAGHSEIRNVYLDLADEWTRRADESEPQGRRHARHAHLAHDQADRLNAPTAPWLTVD